MTKNQVQILIASIGAIAVVLAAVPWNFEADKRDSTVEVVTPATQKTNRVHYIGKVRDEKTTKRIPNAKVSLEGKGVPPIRYTDGEGVYDFDVMNADTLASVKVSVEAGGYELYDRLLTISSNAQIEDIRLTKKSNVEVDTQLTIDPGLKVTYSNIITGSDPLYGCENGYVVIKDGELVCEKLTEMTIGGKPRVGNREKIVDYLNEEVSKYQQSNKPAIRAALIRCTQKKMNY